MKAQYAILRFAKYKGPEIGHIESHNERTKEKYASNPDIDTSRSHLNFHLVFPERKYRAEAEKQLAEYHFVRCNQCYLVNLAYVKGIENAFALVRNARLEISRRQRTALLTAVASYMGGVL